MIAVVLITDLIGAVGFSSFLVLWYYAVANLAALRLEPSERRSPVVLSLVGLAGCLVLALSLSPTTVGHWMVNAPSVVSTVLSPPPRHGHRERPRAWPAT